MPGDQDPTGAGVTRLHRGVLDDADRLLVDAIGLAEQGLRDQDVDALAAAVSANQSVLADLLYWATETTDALRVLGVEVVDGRPHDD